MNIGSSVTGKIFIDIMLKLSYLAFISLNAETVQG